MHAVCGPDVESGWNNKKQHSLQKIRANARANRANLDCPGCAEIKGMHYKWGGISILDEGNRGLSESPCEEGVACGLDMYSKCFDAMEVEIRKQANSTFSSWDPRGCGSAKCDSKSFPKSYP